jgi:serine/threonine protein kinase
MALVSSRCHHCVRYWGWCQAADGAICLIMKRYQQSLHSKLDSLPHRKMPLQQVQRYGKQIAQALSELHAQNILFLDLKPSNILLDEFDNIAVCDFGISRISGSQDPMGMHGTCYYMSPEAFDQDTYGSLSPKSDVWSFACCMVEMVSGRTPWHGANMAAVCYKVASAMEVPGKRRQCDTHTDAVRHRPT